MNKLSNFDSDELFDPSSNDSGEEYVPMCPQLADPTSNIKCEGPSRLVIVFPEKWVLFTPKNASLSLLVINL